MTRRTGTPRAVTRRTAARRARKHTAAVIAKEHAKTHSKTEPETIGQARVWTRKMRRYQIAGLCDVCAAQAAWGHAVGFGKINDPCPVCQPIVNALPNPGPKGSKWRKCLVKLEYLTDEELKEWLADAS